jgi:type VI secretion system protein ImpA
MPVPPVLDVEALLAPIAGENPAGKDLLNGRTYDVIREARRADDALPQGEWVRDVKAANWPVVIEKSSEALALESKDLQIACWLVEALVKWHGFSGLRDGLHLLRELHERFWESFYPEVEDGDLEARANLLAWLNTRLAPTIGDISLTQGANGEKYGWLRWKESREVDNVGRRDQAALAAAVAEGKITGEQFDKATETTPLAYYQELLEDVNQSWEEFAALEGVVEARYGQEAPGLAAMRTAIEECRSVVAETLKKRGGIVPEPPPAPPPKAERGLLGRLLRGREDSATPEGREEAARPVSSPPPTGLSLEPINRSDALRRLAAVAEYFHRTEPHSPVAYLVQRAVRWGEMPLEQWLQDVIHDESVLNQLRDTLGLQDTHADGQS